jgi:hypothetical protein
MAAIDNLKTAWETEIAKISDALIKAKATVLLDAYIAAYTQQIALSAKDIASYSIGGRTFTYRDATAGQNMINGMESDLHDYVYSTSSLVDFNVRTTDSNVT